MPNNSPDNPLHLSQEECVRAGRQLGLTPQESQVVSLIVQDIPAKNIARKLGVRESTVRSHIRLIHAKLKVTSGIGIMLLVLQKLQTLRQQPPQPPSNPPPS